MKNCGLKNVIFSIRSMVRKHSPEILTGIGITGMVTTTVMAVRATPKAMILIEEKKKIDHIDKLSMPVTVKTAWTCYIPTIVIGTVSIGCLVGASSANIRRNTALATAYSLSESALKEYQEKVIEAVGERKEQSIKDSVAKDKLEKNPINNHEVIITERGNMLCFDAVSGRYFKSDMDKLKKAINELNRRMRDEMYISLNEFYYEIGIDPISIGDDLGWNIDSGYIEPNFSSQLATDGTPCLVLGYLIEPKYDYQRY